VLREGYGGRDLRDDLLAGLVVGAVALPLSMALAIAVGVPPQHGLYTAIVAGAVVALLGGSRTQVTGPTAAFVVVLAPVYARFGLSGLLLAGVLAGLILIAMALTRVGRFIALVPHPVTTGFTAGIATVLATLQLKDVFGLSIAGRPDSYLAHVEAIGASIHTFRLSELAVGAATLAVLVVVPRITRRIPPPLVALPLAAIGAALLAALAPDLAVSTIGTRFESTVGGEVVAGIPAVPPLFGWPWLAPGPEDGLLELSFSTFEALLPAAFAIAMLGAIESLLSAVVADGMAQTKHDPDAELLAQGIGNVIAPFFGGIPATGAIARTATNIRFGGKSPIASITHALTVLAAMALLAPLLDHLPMSALAALLLVVAWNMADAKHFVRIVRIAPRSDVVVLLTCFGLTVVFDMIVGVTAGMMLAALLFMQRMAEVTEVRVTSDEDQLTLPGPVPPHVRVYEISGPLFFGAAHKAMGVLTTAQGELGPVVLLLAQVPTIDATGLVALESALASLRSQGRTAILCGARPSLRTAFARAGIDLLDGVVQCDTATEALSLAAAAAPTGPAARESAAPGD
jgi:SulP family sulfate permease